MRAGGTVERQDPVEDRREGGERELARPVAQRPRRVVVHLEEERVHPDRDRRACQRRDEGALAPRRGSLATGDYVPGVSDLDLVALTGGPVGAARQEVLAGLHRELDHGAAHGLDLGCVYVDAGRLGDLGALHPTWTHGGLVQRSLSGVTRAELVRLPGGHYEPFLDGHERVVEAELSFLRTHAAAPVPAERG
jgi:hypothetical protein